MQSLAKGEIHWLFTQTIEIKAFEKGQKEFTIIYLFFQDVFWPQLDVYWTKAPPYFACGDFSTCSIDQEWSPALGSLFLILSFPQHCCWGSPFLPSLSVSWLIAGIELFRPPRATRPPLLLLLLLLLFYTRLNKSLRRECVYWKAIITTQRYLGHFNVLQKRYIWHWDQNSFLAIKWP